MATVSGKFPKRDFLVVLVGGKHCRFKNNDVPSGSDHIGGVGRVICSTQYREGSNLQGAAEQENAMPSLRIGDGGGLHDSALPMNKRNISGDQLGQTLGDPTRSPPPIILGHLPP